jgi:hypothetical protein
MIDMIKKIMVKGRTMRIKEEIVYSPSKLRVLQSFVKTNTSIVISLCSIFQSNYLINNLLLIFNLKDIGLDYLSFIY